VAVPVAAVEAQAAAAVADRVLVAVVAPVARRAATSRGARAAAEGRQSDPR
jgi:hypothetical protein